VPPPPPPRAPADLGLAVDHGDFDNQADDDDQVTAIFDRSTARAMLAGTQRRPPSSPPPPQPEPRAPEVPSIAPVTAVRDTLPPGIDATERMFAESVRPRYKARWAIITASLAMLAAGIGAFEFWPRTGTLTVTGAGPSGATLDMIEIRVDDRVVCQKSPCSVAGLAAGTHAVEVTAPGHMRSGMQMVEIEIGKTAELGFSLTPATTGLRVGALGPNLRLFVDGRDRGPLPASVNDVGAGSHSVRIQGNDRYRPFEQQLTLGPGEIKTIEPKLTVAKGLARLEPGANFRGARVWLVCGSRSKVALALPVAKEVVPDQACRVEASKLGFDTTSLELDFADGQPEKSFTVDLAKKGGAPSAARTSRATARTVTRPAADKPAAANPAPQPTSAKPAAMAGPQGSININSMPVSSVTVDGASAGQTPTHVSVSPGKHTVVFTHPQKGQKSVTVKVKAGMAAGAVVRFD
jgi:hypothetical protein